MIENLVIEFFEKIEKKENITSLYGKSKFLVEELLEIKYNKLNYISIQKATRIQKKIIYGEVNVSVSVNDSFLKDVFSKYLNFESYEDYLFKNKAIVLHKYLKGQSKLKELVKILFKNELYISKNLKSVLCTKNTFEITEYDVFLLQCLSKGLEQKEIPSALKSNNISPNSISSVEKRLKLLKENFNAKNPTQLISITKDFGLI